MYGKSVGSMLTGVDGGPKAVSIMSVFGTTARYMSSAVTILNHAVKRGNRRLYLGISIKNFTKAKTDQSGAENVCQHQAVRAAHGQDTPCPTRCSFEIRIARLVSFFNNGDTL